jgi:hypothetical protein
MLFAALHMSAAGTKLPFVAVQNYVRFLGYNGREMLAVRLSHFDPEPTCGAENFCNANLIFAPISLVANSCFDGLS